MFFVSNNRTGTMSIDRSTLRRNRSGQFETRGFPGIFFLGARNPTVTASTLRGNRSDGFETGGLPGIFFLGAHKPTVTGSTLSH